MEQAAAPGPRRPVPAGRVEAGELPPWESRRAACPATVQPEERLQGGRCRRHHPRRRHRQRRVADRPGRHGPVHRRAALGRHDLDPAPVGLQRGGCRYTVYTGEPIFSGFMRTKPGAAFWGWSYSILGFIQLGWPGWAAAAATGIVAALSSAAVPGAEHAGMVLFWGYVTFFASLILLLLGKKVETGAGVRRMVHGRSGSSRRS